MATVRDVFDFINGFAPYDTQLDFDNAGLLTGSMSQPVHHILCALDCTEAVISQAECLGADMICTHHPLLFSPRKTMTEDDAEGRLLCRLIRGRIALLAAHTNLDAAVGGINDVLAGKCGLQHVTGEGFLRVGDLRQPLTTEELAARLSEELHTTVRIMGDKCKTVTRLGVSSGAGSDAWADALALGADAFLSGEIKHHHALACAAAGMVALEAGHAATETPGIFALADALQNHLNGLQYKVSVSKSSIPAYGV